MLISKNDTEMLQEMDLSNKVYVMKLLNNKWS